jgi:hypothetical protein
MSALNSMTVYPEGKHRSRTLGSGLVYGGVVASADRSDGGTSDLPLIDRPATDLGSSGKAEYTGPDPALIKLSCACCMQAAA